MGSIKRRDMCFGRLWVWKKTFVNRGGFNTRGKWILSDADSLQSRPRPAIHAAAS